MFWCLCCLCLCSLSPKCLCRFLPASECDFWFQCLFLSSSSLFFVFQCFVGNVYLLDNCTLSAACALYVIWVQFYLKTLGCALCAAAVSIIYLTIRKSHNFNQITDFFSQSPLITGWMKYKEQMLNPQALDSSLKHHKVLGIASKWYSRFLSIIAKANLQYVTLCMYLTSI